MRHQCYLCWTAHHRGQGMPCDACHLQLRRRQRTNDAIIVAYLVLATIAIYLFVHD